MILRWEAPGWSDLAGEQSLTGHPPRQLKPGSFLVPDPSSQQLPGSVAPPAPMMISQLQQSPSYRVGIDAEVLADCGKREFRGVKRRGSVDRFRRQLWISQSHSSWFDCLPTCRISRTCAIHLAVEAVADLKHRRGALSYGGPSVPDPCPLSLRQTGKLS
jgi:hypothetical protein